jgi:hypothetical protein
MTKAARKTLSERRPTAKQQQFIDLILSGLKPEQAAEKPGTPDDPRAILGSEKWMPPGCGVA